MREIMTTMAAIIIAVMISNTAIANENYKHELVSYIDDFLKIYPKRAKKSKTYIPVILEECGEEIDPLLVAVIISRESAWRHGVVGYAKGELGLMQVHGIAAKGFRLHDPKEQIRAGIRWLKRSIEWCNGDVKQGLNAYGSGKCKPILPFVKMRVKLWQNSIKKYRKK